MAANQATSSVTGPPPSRASPAPTRVLRPTGPLRYACLRERLDAALGHLNLMACTSLPDFAERDLNNVANIARILVQDVSDVFRVIEHRGFDTPDAA